MTPADLLSRTARDLPVTPLDPAALADLVDRARAHRRRRRAGLAAGTLAGAALLAIAVPSWLPDGSAPRQEAATAVDPATPAASPGASPAPVGTRWVGAAGVQVAVPTDWPVRPGPCVADPVGVYLLPRDETVDCLGTPPGADLARVVVDRPNGGAGRGGQSGAASGEVTCEGDLCTAVRSFGAQNVEVRVEVSGADARERAAAVIATAGPIPAGRVAVPTPWTQPRRQLEAALEAVGLILEAPLHLQAPDSGADEGTGDGTGDGTGEGTVPIAPLPQVLERLALILDPAPGTVVPRGTTVRVTPGSAP
ncbi:hypothetical protein [Nocardioides sp.]|uniref:hypothetical protein n=1 Tax=Nocardioides sp. TaxID=35761 RepID=UPI003514078B